MAAEVVEGLDQGQRQGEGMDGALEGLDFGRRAHERGAARSAAVPPGGAPVFELFVQDSPWRYWRCQRLKSAYWMGSGGSVAGRPAVHFLLTTLSNIAQSVAPPVRPA